MRSDPTWSQDTHPGLIVTSDVNRRTPDQTSHTNTNSYQGLICSALSSYLSVGRHVFWLLQKSYDHVNHLCFGSTWLLPSAIFFLFAQKKSCFILGIVWSTSTVRCVWTGTKIWPGALAFRLFEHEAWSLWLYWTLTPDAQLINLPWSGGMKVRTCESEITVGSQEKRCVAWCGGEKEAAPQWSSGISGSWVIIRLRAELKAHSESYVKSGSNESYFKNHTVKGIIDRHSFRQLIQDLFHVYCQLLFRGTLVAMDTSQFHTK